KAGMEQAVEVVVEEIKKMAVKVVDSDVAKVATISAQSEQIGKLIAEALNKVGKDGVVTVEEGRGVEMEIEYKGGMEFDKGYASAYFATNEKMEAEVDKPYILITDKKLSSLQELLPFLESLVKVSKNLVIIADDIEGEALTAFVLNKLKGALNVLAVKAPGFGDRRKEMLEDIAVLTGGTVISEDSGKKIEAVTVDDCGQADKIWADKDNTRIIGGKGQKTMISSRINQIKNAISETESEFDKEKLQERLSKLAGGVAVINVGAATEVEMKDKKERVNDAVAATKAALEEGIVPGGGVTLLKARKVLAKLRAKLENEDQKIGLDILYQSLGEPLKMIAKNAGENEAQVLAKVEGNDSTVDFGFNVMTGQYGSMLKAGIVDP